METRSRVVIRMPLDVFEARRAARALATRHGFGPRGRQSAEIVASELATNVLKHGREGELLVELSACAVLAGLRLTSTDRGPRIHDLAQAMRDRADAHGPLDPAAYWGRRGIGSGLGAIVRLSDAFEYHHTGEGNLFVVLIHRDAAERRLPGRG